jgi:hypothetical protein
VLFDNERIELSDEISGSIKSCFDFLQRFSSDKIIYGINTKKREAAQNFLNSLSFYVA